MEKGKSMKLRNKKTGEIKEVIVGGYPVSGKTKMWEYSEMDSNEETGYKTLGTYTSLTELNAEWEDYEDPKGSALDLMILTLTNFIENVPDEDKVDLKDCRQMLEKLKAWKRLKDKGFRVLHKKVIGEYINVSYILNYPATNVEEKDLNLLIGGEE